MTTDDTTSGPSGHRSPRGHDDAPHYEIRVVGHLPARWARRFDGLSITTEPGGTTALRGPIPDQAALHGVLHALRDAGISLVSLTPVPPDAGPDADAHEDADAHAPEATDDPPAPDPRKGP